MHRFFILPVRHVAEILHDSGDAMLHDFIQHPPFYYSCSVAPLTKETSECQPRNLKIFYDGAEEICTINTDWNNNKLF